MDLEAKAWWDACKHNPSYFQYTTPKGMWKVSLLGNRVVNRLTSYLRESIEGGKVAEYWIKKKKKFTEESFFCVDWEAIKAAMGKVGPQRRRWVSKFEAGICATGPMMVHWKQRLVPNCPRCMYHTESTTHILQCQSKSALLKWETALQSFSEWLTLVHTCGDISTFLITAIDQWRSKQIVTPPSEYSFKGIQECYQEQSLIGWRQLMGGCISRQWSVVQQEY